MQIHYLEIVSPDVDALCATYAKTHNAAFNAPIPELGNARIADLSNGGRIGIRAPMSADETATIRPYILVEDIDAAIKAAEQSGADIAHPPLELPGEGTFAIYIQGGVQHGLWQI